ncbi:MAG: type II secretion system F family protein [Candidatus Rokubacteria bacterium]|nr:type II secretion system F family protein [Candidatus Rokubacteria bacterium]
MPVFVYRAADQRGKTIAGVMEAPDSRAVVERLHREEYYPIEVAPQAGSAGLWLRLPARGISSRDLVAFTQQLATLFEAGLPLDRALSVLEELAPNARLKTILEDLLKSVRGGASFGEALAKHHPRPFSRLYINMVRAGEKGGVLEVTLRRLAEFLEAAQEFKEAIVSALIYPALLTSVGGAAVVFLLTFVIPRFAEIFADLGQAIPLPTQILLTVSSALRDYWWALALAVVAGVLGSRIVLATEDGRLAWDRAALRLPLVGEVIRKAEVARFCRTLGTLLRSGVPVLGALAVVKEMVSNRLLSLAVERLGDGVKRGAGLSGPMGESGVFPPLALHMVRVGEETGRLEDMLLKVSDTFEADVRSRVKRLIGLLEPSIILIMGLLVGFIVVAMLMAIFSINEIPL